MHKIFLFSISILCLFSLIYLTTPETDARRQDKGKSRILELIESEESAILAKKTPGISLSVQEISEIVVPVLIYTDDKNDTKSILDSGSIEKYEVFEHIDFVYAYINKSTLDALDLNSNTIFLFENKIFYAPEPVFSTETIQPTTTLSSTYTGKGNVVAIIDTGITNHPFITGSGVTALDGSSIPRIVYQECHSQNYQATSDGVTHRTWSLCEDIDSNGAGDDAVIDQAKNPAMHCDTSITEGLEDCAHGLYVASAISGEKPAGETASTPSPSAPDTQLAIYKVSHGYVCNDGNTDSTDGCVDGVEFVSLAVSEIADSINSIIGKKKEYLNGDEDGDAGLNIVSVNMSIGATTGFSSTECPSGSSSVGSLLYSRDSSKNTLYKYNVAMVTSSGNEFQRNGEALFGCLPKALSVAALNSSVNNPEVASFSNIAPFTDFIDNGQGIRVAVIDGGGYGATSGTSLSSPKVAGLYSVLAQKYPDATVATVDKLTKRLKTFATFFGDTRTSAVNTTAKFPQPNIEEALSGEPIISRSQIKDISTAYDEASNTYSTIEDSLDIEFVSDTSRAYITSASGGHFTGEIDATAVTNSTNGVSVFSVTIPITDGITDTIFINTVDDLTTNDDIISTNLFIIEETALPTVFVEAVDTNTQTGDFDINVTFSTEVSNVDIGDFRLVLKDADSSTAPTFGTIVVQKHSDSNFNDTSPTTTDTTTTQLSGTYFKVIVSPQDGLMTDDGVTEYAFQVIDDKANSSSIEDGANNPLGAQGLSDIIRATTDISIDTAHPKTESISLVTSGKQTSTFDVNVTFSESVENVTIGNFEFTDGTVSVGEITKVEMHSDSNFNDTNPSTTTDATTLSGRFFKITINLGEDISDTYTFKVLPTSITDNNGNIFQTSTEDDKLDIDVDTNTRPTLTTLSITNPSVTPKNEEFKVNIVFSEVVYGVNIEDFQFTDGSTSVASITKVEVFDSAFSSSIVSTTDTTEVSGQYFSISIDPNDDLYTDTTATPPVTHTFEVLSSKGIADGASNSFDVTGGAATTLDVIVNTSHPKTESISLVTSGTQTSTFDVDVTFSESVNNVGISNFEFTDGSTSVANITKIAVHSDSNFNDTNPNTTTDLSTLSGRYFRVSINPIDDINGTYTFKVLSTSIIDDDSNPFQTSTDDDKIDIDVNTITRPTLTTLSITNPSVTPKNEEFKVNVVFSEVVYGVNIEDFQFTYGTTSVASITKVEVFDSVFSSSSVSTTDTTEVSGQYFRVSIDPNDDLYTDTTATPPVTYIFEVLSSEGIADGASHSFNGTGGAATTLDVVIDTLNPVIINAKITNNKLVLTSTLAFDDATVVGSGGFAVTGENELTTYTVSIVTVSDKTITITFSSDVTTPKERGTYSYTKDSSLTIQTKSTANTPLAKISNAEYKPDFTLDFDGSKSFTAASDAFFLYLYRQNQDGGVDITDGVLGQAIFGGVNNVLATKARVQAGIDGGYLDFDGSEDFTAASDAFFLYLYRQDQDGGVDITDGVLGQAIFGGVNNVPATKARVDSLIVSIPSE